MSSRTITSVVTSDTIALNAAVFGYSGHSLVTPHTAIQQVWWTDERIQSKVTKEFITSKLKRSDKDLLDSPFAIGNDDLTNDNYIDRILHKSKRLFLILVETGLTHHIFSIIDEAWDDDDLPVSLNEIDKLFSSSNYPKDNRISQKFYNNQFKYLLRQLTQGSHISYSPQEIIPLQYVHRLPPAATLQKWHKMHPPSNPNMIYVRRRIPLFIVENNGVKVEDLLQDIGTSAVIKHSNISPIWASYTSKEFGYILTDFEAEHTLKSFIDFRQAASVQKISKKTLSRIIISWIYCLSDALAVIHNHGLFHSTIVPSNILINAQNKIAFSDIGCLKTLQSDKKIDYTEIYNYTPPECHSDIQIDTESGDFENTTLKSRLAKTRQKLSIDSIWSLTGFHRPESFISSRSTVESSRSFSPLPPLTPNSMLSSSGSNKKFSISTLDSNIDLSAFPLPRTPLEKPLTRPFLTPPREYTPYSSSVSTPITSKHASIVPNTLNFNLGVWEPRSLTLMPDQQPEIGHAVMPESSAEYYATHQKGDIFSLACVYIDLLTYLCRKKPSQFLKLRSRRRRPRPLSTSYLQHIVMPAASQGESMEAPPSLSFNSSTSVSGHEPVAPGTDASFAANPMAVHMWLSILEETAAQIATDDEIPVLGCLPDLIELIKTMMSIDPGARPTADIVRVRIEDIIRRNGGLQLDDFCECRSNRNKNLGYGEDLTCTHDEKVRQSANDTDHLSSRKETDAKNISPSGENLHNPSRGMMFTWNWIRRRHKER